MPQPPSSARSATAPADDSQESSSRDHAPTLDLATPDTSSSGDDLDGPLHHLPDGGQPELTVAADAPGYYRRWVYGVLLSLLVAAVFGRTVDYGFTNWDDPIYIYRDNPYVRGLTVENIKALFTPGAVPREMIYIPLTYLSHLLESALFDLRPEGVHTVNVLLHTLNVLLVFTFIGRLARDWRVALVTAAAFAVHPLQVEAVAWAMGRKDLLSTAFALIALITYLHRLDTYRRLWTAITLLAFVGAVLSKPTMIILPLLLVMLDYYRLPRVGALEWGNKIAFIAISLVVYRLNTLIQPDAPDVARSGLFRLLCLPVVAWDWTVRLLLLDSPVAIYGWPASLEWARILPGMGVLLVLLALALFAWRRDHGWLLFGLLFSGVAFVPAASIVMGNRQFLTADRYGYFPLIGLFFLIARAVIPRAAEPVAAAAEAGQLPGAADLATAEPPTPSAPPSRWRLLPALGVAVWLIAAGALAIPAVRVWGSSETLWQGVLERDPANHLALANLAMTYVERNNPMYAERLFQKAIAANPKGTTTINNYGFLLLQEENFAAAAEQFRKVLAMAPENASAYAGLGMTLERLGQFDDARAMLQRAVELNPSRANPVMALGRVHEQLGNLNGAMAAYLLGTQYHPNDAAFAFALASVLEQAGETARAIVVYRHTVELAPGNATAWYRLARLLAASDDTTDAAEAEQAYRQALANDSQLSEAWIDLGQLLHRRGRLDDAESLYRQGLAISSQHADIAHFNLGQIYAARQDWPRAAEEYRASAAANPAFKPATGELEALARDGHLPPTP